MCEFKVLRAKKNILQGYLYFYISIHDLQGRVHKLYESSHIGGGGGINEAMGMHLKVWLS